MARFTTKKIGSMTLGEQMKKVREERRLSLVEISRNIRVQVKYLEYLENGDYVKLPAQVYVKGFLRNYAVFMGINSQNLIRQYEREQKIQQNIKKEVFEKNEIRPIKFSSFIVTPKKIMVSLGLLVVFLGFIYLYKQINNFVSTPRLSVMTPTDGISVESRTVRVAGVAEKGAQLFINDQSILVSEEGKFSEDIDLREGLNSITVVARNKFEKETRQAISVNAVYQNPTVVSLQESSMNENNKGNKEDFSLEVRIVADSSWISVEADGSLLFSGTLTAGTTQTFTAKEKIGITSSEGNGTYIKIKGKEEEILSPQSGVVRDIFFTPDGRVSL